MPVMDGYEATRLLKESYPDLPIVVQTAYATENDRRKAFEHGCDEFLTKPIQKEQLAEVLLHFLT
jgi:CheY-like chemotaxis protein